MILLFGLVMALICGLLAASKAGFVSSWTRLLNTAVAVYLAVYLTPTLGSSFAFIGEHPYGAVLCALAVALVTFIGLNAICGLILGDLKIEIAKVVDAVGGGVMGFVNGLLLWGFICLLLWISPVADFVMDGHISSRDEVQQMWYSSIGTNMAVMNAVTFQSRPQPLS
ncbi:MAG TPA: CvpA family protein, partial [Sedimentisphaerales bacterium]|nr:CvpA family protein [Sedimentisphaerales bacterium]